MNFRFCWARVHKKIWRGINEIPTTLDPGRAIPRFSRALASRDRVRAIPRHGHRRKDSWLDLF